MGGGLEMKRKHAFGLAMVPLAVACSNSKKIDRDHMTKAQAQEAADRLNQNVHGDCGRRYVQERQDGGWAVVTSFKGCVDVDHVRVLKIDGPEKTVKQKEPSR
jgi:hypothetical protein